MFEIEKEISVPPSRTGSARNPKYPFGQMVAGDSFTIDGGDRKKVAAAASAFGRYHNKKFCTRMVEGGQVRVWRIE